MGAGLDGRGPWRDIAAPEDFLSYRASRHSTTLRAAQSRFALGACAISSTWGIASFEVLTDPIISTILLLNAIQYGYVASTIASRHAMRKTAIATDGLTGIANRCRFDATLVTEWRRSRRQHTAIGLLLIDIDHVKGYNDTLGHQAGDDCLKRVAACIAGAKPPPRRSCRPLRRRGVRGHSPRHGRVRGDAHRRA